MQVTEHTPNEPLGLGIKAIQEEIEQTESAQTQVEEEMGLLDPMTYTERAGVKQAKVQKTGLRSKRRRSAPLHASRSIRRPSYPSKKR